MPDLLIGVIVVIVIVARVMTAIKNATKNTQNVEKKNNVATTTTNGYRGDVNDNGLYPNGQSFEMQKRYTQPAQNSTNKANVTSMGMNNNANQGKSITPNIKQSANQQVLQENKQNENKLSTVEYLKQKAEADSREHLKEKREEEYRRRTESQIPCALRYTGFETVGHDQKIVKCDYCWAENMVPKIYRGKYRCYFCREELKL